MVTLSEASFHTGVLGWKKTEAHNSKSIKWYSQLWHFIIILI